MGPGELTDEQAARQFGATCPVPVLDESQRAAAKPWAILTLIAKSAPILLHIVVAIAFCTGWVRPKAAMLIVIAGYIVSEYAVMVARSAISRIEGSEQPSWLRTIAISGVLAAFCLVQWLV